ncbi:MAG: TetR/AcrR family transcriptional regulator [Planctomycetes bacterium]|nr:TetR/AcrR family transcriptional regulator [Planctomycetota bacterium]
MPSQPDPDGASTRQRMLDAAFELFHGQGVSGTSVDAVLRASGTGKSQLYHYFGSKEGLVEAVVEDFEAKLSAGLLPGTDDIETVEDLERWFGMFVGFQRETGCTRHCPMATIAATLTPENEPIRRRIEGIFERSRAVLLRFFEKQAAEGALVPESDPEALADFCYAIMQGGLIVARVRRDPTPFSRAVSEALSHVRRVLGK